MEKSRANAIHIQLEMWANAQRDGRPAEYRWRLLFNAAKFGPLLECRAAKTRNPLTLAGVPQTNKMVSAASGPKFTILQGHVGKTLLFNKFFSIVDMCLSCEDIARQSLRWCADGEFLAIYT